MQTIVDTTATEDVPSPPTATSNDSYRDRESDIELRSLLHADFPYANTHPSEFCTHCQNLFEHFSRLLQDHSFKISHHQQLSELETAAASGCPLCYQFLRSKQHDIDRIRYRVGTSSPDSRFGSIAVSRRENSDGPAFSTSDAYTLELECNYTMEYTGLDGRIENLPQCTKFVVVGVPSQLACKHPLPALFQSGAW
jgi:hypothetical protein